MLKEITYKNITQNAPLFFALLIAFCLPELKFVLSYFIVAWILFSFFQLKFKNNIKQNLSNSFNKFIFFSQLTFFIIIISELLFTENNTEVLKNIIQKLSFLLFPILFSLSRNIFKQKKELFLKLFVLSNVLSSVICLIFAFYNSSNFVNGQYIFNNLNFEENSYFTGGVFSQFIHRGYFSMFLVFSVAIIFFFNERQIWFKTSKSKIWFYITTLFFSIIIYFLESRVGLISLFIIVFLYLIYKILSFNRIIYKVASVVIIIFMAFLVLQNSRIQMTLKKIANIENGVRRDSDARIVLWSAAVDIIENNFFTGIGISNFKEKFSQQYEKYDSEELQSAGKMKYNVHNQFLEIWVLYGFFVFLLFLLIFVVSIIYSIRKRNFLFFAFLLIVFMNFLFESIIETISGIIFTTYFLNYFVFVFEHKKSQIKK